MRSDAIKPGDVIAGKYRVRAIMGRSRGFLVDALHNDFDQRLAIRVLPPQLVDPRQVERFHREAHTLARLASEHAARIFDVGTLPDGAFYFARQYLDGKDLAAHLQQRGALTLSEAVLFILQAAEAIAEAHAYGVVLREIKPAHLFVTQRIGGQQVKIVDFGTAKLMREAGVEGTATASVGLSCYASPELVRRAPGIDARADVWSLGAILYEMIAGRPPFQGEVAHLMHAITREEPLPLSRLRAGLPAAFDAVIARALAKDLQARFADVDAFAYALSPFATAEGQVLVRRICDVLAAARGEAPAPVLGSSDPIAATSRIPAYLAVADMPLNDDAAHTAFIGADMPAASPSFTANTAKAAGAPAPQPEGSPLERTMFMGADYAAPSPASPAAKQARASQPAPPLAPPPLAPPLAPPPLAPPIPAHLKPASTLPLDPGIAVPAPANPAGTLPLDSRLIVPAGPAPAGLPRLVPSEAPQRELRPTHPAAKLPATAQTTLVRTPGSGTVVRLANAPQRGQMVALLAVAGAVVLLSIVAVVVVLRGRSTADATAQATSAAASAPHAATASAAPAARPSAAPTSHAAPTATAAATASAEPAAEPAGHAAPLRAPAKAEPEPEPAPPSNPDEGTLVAVAVGGTCAFTVNGASKGTTSTLKLTLPPGSYTVTCAPASGPSKSRSVTVTGGGTATAMFKL